MPWIRLADGDLAHVDNERAGRAARQAVNMRTEIKTTVAKPERCGSCGGVIRQTGECRCSD